jgi:hypothetical protein
MFLFLFLFPVTNDLKRRVILLPFLFKFALENAIRSAQVKHDGLKCSGTHQRLVYVGSVNVLDGNLHTVTNNTAALLVTSRETGIEESADKTPYMVVSRDQNVG